MKSIKANVSDSGRVSLPAEFRRALGLEHGGAVVIELADNEIRIRTPAEGLRRAQEMARRVLGPNASSKDFIAWRRRDSRE
jgi:AbrB family looped-hinge helix DNA binding protein